MKICHRELKLYLDLPGHSISGTHANNLATHRNVFSPASKKVGTRFVDGHKTPDEELRCQSCKKECSKQRFYRKQVSAEGISLLV